MAAVCNPSGAETLRLQLLRLTTALDRLGGIMTTVLVRARRRSARCRLSVQRLSVSVCSSPTPCAPCLANNYAMYAGLTQGALSAYRRGAGA